MATYRPKYHIYQFPTPLKFKPDWTKIATYAICGLFCLGVWGLVIAYCVEKIR